MLSTRNRERPSKILLLGGTMMGGGRFVMEFIVSFEVDALGPDAARLEALPKLVAQQPSMAGTEVRRLVPGAAMGARGRSPQFRVTVREVTDAAKAAQEVVKAIAGILLILAVASHAETSSGGSPVTSRSCDIQLRSGSSSMDLRVPLSDDRDALEKALEDAVSKLPQPPSDISIRPGRY